MIHHQLIKLLLITSVIVVITDGKFITKKAFEMLEHFWRLGWPGFNNFNAETFPHLKGVHVNHHIWKERGNILPFGLPVEGILERSFHPYHGAVKSVQPMSPVLTHLVGNIPNINSRMFASALASHQQQQQQMLASNLIPNHIDPRQGVGNLMSSAPPVDGSFAGTIAKITAQAVSGADVHPTEDPLFPSPYDNSPQGPPSKEEYESAKHHTFTHNRLYHDQRTLGSIYTHPNEMFQGKISFKPLAMYSGGKHTWDPVIFDRHFESMFDISKLSNPANIHSSEASAAADSASNMIHDILNENSNIDRSSSIHVPSKIHAKHIPEILDIDTYNDGHLLESQISSSTSDELVGSDNKLANPWDKGDMVTTSSPIIVAEDRNASDELSFLDELALIVASDDDHHDHRVK